MSLLDITTVSEEAKPIVVAFDKPERKEFCATSRDVSVSAEVTASSETTASIVQHLLSQGVSMEDIIMPGSAKKAGIYVADDFDAPLEDFEDCL